MEESTIKIEQECRNCVFWTPGVQTPAGVQTGECSEIRGIANPGDLDSEMAATQVIQNTWEVNVYTTGDWGCKSFQPSYSAFSLHKEVNG